MICSKNRLKKSYENYRTDINEKLLNEDMLVFGSDRDSDATLPGFLKFAVHTQHLYRYCVKMKSSSLPAP